MNLEKRCHIFHVASNFSTSWRIDDNQSVKILWICLAWNRFRIYGQCINVFIYFIGALFETNSSRLEIRYQHATGRNTLSYISPGPGFSLRNPHIYGFRSRVYLTTDDYSMSTSVVPSRPKSSTVNIIGLTNIIIRIHSF